MLLRFRLYGFFKNLRFFDPFVILFFREAGLSFLAIGTLYSVREIASNLLEIPTGVVADAFGRRRALLAAFAGYFLSFALLFAFRGFAPFACAMALFGAANALRSGTHKALILEHLRQRGIDSQKVAYYGRTRAASLLGSAVAAILAAALVYGTGGYRIVFLASLVPYALGFLLILSYPRSLDPVAPIAGWRDAGARLHVAFRQWLRLFRVRELNRGLMSSAAFDALFRTLKDYLQPILQAQALALPILVAQSETQRGAVLVGALYAVLYLASSFASSRAGAVEARARSLAAAANALLATGIGVVVLAGAFSALAWYGLAAFAFVALHIIQNVRRPLMVGYLAEWIPHASMASGLSAEAQAKTLLVACGAPLIGFLADRLGIGPAMLAIGGAFLLLTPLLRVRPAATSG